MTEPRCSLAYPQVCLGSPDPCVLCSRKRERDAWAAYHAAREQKP